MRSFKEIPDIGGAASSLCDDLAPCHAVKEGVKSIADPVINIIDFGKDPFGYIASTLEQTCEDLARKLFGALVSVLHPDFSVDWFIKAYEVSFALGIIIMGFLFLAELTAYRKGQRGTDEILDNVFTAVPMYFLGVIIGPFVGNLLCTMTGSLCDDLVNWGGGTGGMAGSSDMLTQLIILGTPDAMLGGTIICIAIFSLMIVAFFCLTIGMITMLVTLYMSGVTFPIGWAWIVRNRDKQVAYKVVNVFLGIALSQPIVFFMLGFVNRMLKANLFGDGNTGGVVNRFVALLAGTLALFMVALSPWAAAKFSPIGARAGGPNAEDLKRMASNFGGGRKSSGSDGQLGQVSRMQSASEEAGAGEGLGGLSGGLGEGGAGEGAAAGAAGAATGGAAVAAAVAAKAAQKADEAADEANDVASSEGEGDDDSQGSDEAQGSGEDQGALSDAASSQAESDDDSVSDEGGAGEDKSDGARGGGLADAAAANAQASQEEDTTPGTDGTQESDPSGSALGEQAQKESEGDQEAQGGHDGVAGEEGSALTDAALAAEEAGETGGANPGGKKNGGKASPHSLNGVAGQTAESDNAAGKTGKSRAGTSKGGPSLSTGNGLSEATGETSASENAEGKAGKSDSGKNTGGKPSTSGLGNEASSEVSGAHDAGGTQNTDADDHTSRRDDSSIPTTGSGLGEMASSEVTGGYESGGTAADTDSGSQNAGGGGATPAQTGRGLDDMASSDVTGSGDAQEAGNSDNTRSDHKSVSSDTGSGLSDVAAAEVASGHDHGGHAQNTAGRGEGVSPDSGSGLGEVAATETAAGLNGGGQTVGGDAVPSDTGHGLGDVASSEVVGEAQTPSTRGGSSQSTEGGGDMGGNPFLASMVEHSASEPALTTSASTGQAGAVGEETGGKSQGSYAAIGSDPSYALIRPNPNPSRASRVISGVNKITPGRNRGTTAQTGSKHRHGWAMNAISAVKNPPPGAPSRALNSLSALSAFMDAQTTSHLRAGDKRGE